MTTGQDRAPARTLAIVGGGASGAILAIQAMRAGGTDCEVVLIEKRAEPGRGIAYSTPEPDHRLNVRASNMSIFAGEPSHFADWLKRKSIRQDDFEHFYAPRGLYGDYVGETLRAEPGRLRIVHETALSVVPKPTGVESRLADGNTLRADAAVLATGHEEAASSSRPYAVKLGSKEDTPLDPALPVMILGTGLSMADAWLSLARRGQKGPVIALSRRGLMPMGHQGHAPIKLDRADIPLGTDLTYFVHWFRGLIRDVERRGGDWRDVVDGLRPFNQEIWRNWPASAKRRFFEHTKPWWDVHRHRMAPEIRERIFAAVDDGALRVVAARVREVEPDGEGGWRVRFQHRHTSRMETVNVARVYDCGGIVSDLSQGTNPLIRSMIASGTARPDLLRIGLDVSEACAVIDKDGQASDRIFAVGPLTRGAFLEIDAIPDIRVQCEALAKRLMGALAQGNRSA